MIQYFTGLSFQLFAEKLMIRLWICNSVQHSTRVLGHINKRITDHLKQMISTNHRPHIEYGGSPECCLSATIRKDIG